MILKFYFTKEQIGLSANLHVIELTIDTTNLQHKYNEHNFHFKFSEGNNLRRIICSRVKCYGDYAKFK